MLASDAGGDYTQVYNGILLNVSARLRNGLTFQGGFNTGTTGTDYCDVRAALAGIHRARCAEPDQSVVRHVHGLGDAVHRSRFVHRAEGRRARLGNVPQRQGLAAGREHGVHERVRRRSAAPFANNAPNVTVNLIEPGTLYGDRVNELDLRFAKILRFGRTRTNVGFDIYNILNSAPILTYNQAFNPTINTTNPSANWLAPQSTLQPRFMKFSAQIDF